MLAYVIIVSVSVSVSLSVSVSVIVIEVVSVSNVSSIKNMNEIASVIVSTSVRLR